MPFWRKIKPPVHSWIEVLDVPAIEVEIEVEPGEPVEVGSWVEFYKDRRGEWRWRRIRQWESLPPDIVADGGEGYDKRSEGLRAARRENPDYKIIEL